MGLKFQTYFSGESRISDPKKNIVTNPQMKIPKKKRLQSIFFLEVIIHLIFFLWIDFTNGINNNNGIINDSSMRKRYKLESIPKSANEFCPLSANFCMSLPEAIKAFIVIGI